MGLRLPVGGVTVLLGPTATRAATLAALDPDSAQCAEGHRSLSVRWLTAGAGDDVQARLGAVDAALAEAAHARCLDVHLYTVNKTTEMQALVDLGVDGMFTNFPDRWMPCSVRRRVANRGP